MEPIVIPLSKQKLLLILAGSAMFVVAGIYFLIQPATFISPITPNETIIFIVGALAILFFGVCAIYAMKKLFDTNPGLMIDGQGITDNSSATSAGLIPWTDITGVSMAQVQNQRFILIMVTDPESYIAAQKDSFKRRMMKINSRMYNTPVCISANGLKTNFDELYKTIGDQYSQHKKA